MPSTVSRRILNQIREQLGEEIVPGIQQLVDKGLTQVKIAKLLGIDDSYLSAVLHSLGYRIQTTIITTEATFPIPRLVPLYPQSPAGGEPQAAAACPNPPSGATAKTPARRRPRDKKNG